MTLAREYESGHFRPELTVLSTQAQLTGPLGAMFLHLPGFFAVVVQAALEQVSLLPFSVHAPSDTMPAICKIPGKPVNLAQVPAYDTAVTAVTMAPAATINTRDADKALLILPG